MIDGDRRVIWTNLVALLAVLFLFSPVFNFYFFFYSGFYINFTSIFLVSFVLVSCFDQIKIKKNDLLTYSIGLLLICYAGFSIIYSPSENYSKVKFFFLFCHYVFFVFLSFKKGKGLEECIAKYLYWSAIISALLFVVNSSVILGSADKGRELNEGLNASIYLMTGFLVGFSSLHFLIFSNHSNSFKIMVLVLSSVVILYTGSRGPMIFLLICSFFYFSFLGVGSFSRFIDKKRLVWSGAFCLVFLLAFFSVLGFTDVFKADEFSRAFARLYKLSDLSSTGRIKHFDFVLNADYSIFQLFLGRGLGSYGYYIYGLDSREYPHNIFLELWFELGVVGILFFLIFIVSIFVRVGRSAMGIFFFSLYPFFELMKSSSFSDFRPFWFACAISVVVLGCRKKEAANSMRVPLGKI